MRKITEYEQPGTEDPVDRAFKSRQHSIMESMHTACLESFTAGVTCERKRITSLVDEILKQVGSAETLHVSLADHRLDVNQKTGIHRLLSSLKGDISQGTHPKV